MPQMASGCALIASASTVVPLRAAPRTRKLKVSIIFLLFFLREKRLTRLRQEFLEICGTSTAFFKPRAPGGSLDVIE
jgi:hypothetical protein